MNPLKNLSLFDLNGKQVKNIAQGQFFGEGSNSLEVDLSELSPGIYMYRLNHSTGSLSGKVVKQ